MNPAKAVVVAVWSRLPDQVINLAWAYTPGLARRVEELFVRDDDAFLAALHAKLLEHERLRTMGGPPPPVDTSWGNRELPGGPDPEYRGLR